MKWKRLRPTDTDYLIPWTDKYTNEVFQRFYHLYTEAEIHRLMEDIAIANVVRSIQYCFECDNWVLILEK